MTTRRALLTAGILAGAAALLGGGFAVGSYRATLASAHRRIAGQSRILQTPYGAMEYATAGRGAPFLMVHGAGGGFDQGLHFGDMLRDKGFEVIAPSRFGYLDSDMPENPSPALQADAFAALLDHLEIDRVAIVGGSAGALSAAEFAIRHPHRCTHLVLLVPAVNVTGSDPVEFSALQRAVVARILTSDRWFWVFRAFAPDLLLRTLLATDPDMLRQAPDPERQRAQRIMDDLLPISRRTRGLEFDGRLTGQPTTTDFTQITVPTLLISCEDDLFGTADTARVIASRIDGSRCIIYPSGGHIWLGHDSDIAGEIRSLVGGAGQSAD